MDFLKHQSESSTGWEELQEPVPFEDFKFSFGLDPEFSIPLPPLDTTMNASSTTSTTLPSVDPMLTDEIFPSFDLYSQAPTPPPASLNNIVLDEQDQKIFSNFLDTFFVDLSSNTTPSNNNNNTLFDNHASSSYFMPPLHHGFQANQDDDLEEQRRNSILQSLDHQKQKLHDRLNFLSTTTTNTTTTTTPSSLLKRRSSSVTNNIQSHKKQKSEHGHHKELLTEEEKRANHIASEQKRRSTIRTGFKDLTEIIPTLKNIHHSKSTVLFKAVDFIKHLDRRNKLRREKLQQLQVRLALKNQRPSLSSSSSSSSSVDTSASPQHSPTTTLSSSTTADSLATSPSAHHPPFPPNVTAALRAHKSQQAQLLQLQEQLQLHQRLLARQQSLQASAPPPKAGFRAVMHDADDDPFFKPTLSA